MKENKNNFESFIFKLPKLWEQDWEVAVDRSVGERNLLLKNLSNSTKAIKTASKWSVTPENLAWLVLWSRNWTLTTSAIGALDSKSDFLLEILWRSVFELNLQLSLIINPNAPMVMPKNEYTHDEINELKDRLCAFAAWSLMNDQKNLNNRLNKKNMNTVFKTDNKEEETIEAQFEDMVFALWGDSERPIVGEEAAKAKKAAREDLFSRRNIIVNFLKDYRLVKWRNMIERERPRTFFALMSKFDSSIGQRLNSIGLDIAKLLYDLPSNLIHGSTMEGFINIQTKTIYPKVAITESDAEQGASSVRRYCHNNGVALEVLEAILDFEVSSENQ